MNRIDSNYSESFTIFYYLIRNYIYNARQWKLDNSQINELSFIRLYKECNALIPLLCRCNSHY